jgi:hypothetical protein
MCPAQAKLHPELGGATSKASNVLTTDAQHAEFLPQKYKREQFECQKEVKAMPSNM